MYRIDFKNADEAVEIIYCFMTIPALTNPECTIWDESGISETLTNDGTGFMTEQDFCKRIISSEFVAISCVASTDKADTRRVALSLMPDTDYMVLNFPSANGKPNDAEKRVLKLLELKNENI